MTVERFVSYAQNGEDVVLHRALAGRIDAGFYIDIGACHPIHDSVTAAFYRRGWHGLNVEPDEVWHRELLQARLRDVNILAAIGSQRGRATFYPTAIRGQGTLKPDIAASRPAGRPAAEIPVFPLADAIDCYATGFNEIAFLKIDVEGAERDVLASGDWQRHRPLIVLVEAVDQIGAPTHEGWEPILLQNRYSFALFDGLNRFYVRDEDAASLLPRMSAPANVLDDWTPFREHELREQITALTAERDRTDVRREALAVDAEEARARAVAIEANCEQRIAAALLLAQERAAAEQDRALDQFLAELERSREELASALRREEQLEQSLADLEITKFRHAKEVAGLSAEIESARAVLDASLTVMRRSTSWRITAPVRAVAKLTRPGARADA